jgi:hypothetical protein
MHVLIKVKSSNNINKWQVGFNSAFKGLTGSKSVKVSGVTHMLALNIEFVTLQHLKRNCGDLRVKYVVSVVTSKGL